MLLVEAFLSSPLFFSRLFPLHVPVTDLGARSAAFVAIPTLPPAVSRAPAADEQLPLGLWGSLFALLMALLWAGTSVTAREAADRVPPLAIGGIRFALASLFMLWWCRWEGVSFRLRRGQWTPTIVMGVLLFLQIGAFNIGVAWSNASHTTLLVNTYIFWVAGYEHFVTGAIRMTRRQILGLLIATAGTVVLVQEATPAVTTGSPAAIAPSLELEEQAARPRDTPTLAGDAVLALSGLILAVKVMYTKYAVRVVPSGTLILWHDVIGTALFFLSSAALETWHPDPWTPSIVVSLLYAGLVVSGLCFAGHAWLLRRHSASSVSVFSFATPVFGVVLAVLLRGDRLSGWLVLSGGLVAIGLVLLSLGNGSPQSTVTGEEDAKLGHSASSRGGSGEEGLPLLADESRN
jgi:drug/metabolite transporter (DMT)-like permease